MCEMLLDLGTTRGILAIPDGVVSHPDMRAQLETAFGEKYQCAKASINLAYSKRFMLLRRERRRRRKPKKPRTCDGGHNSGIDS